MKEDYALFSGVLDTLALERFLKYVANSINNHVEHIHLMFQSDGGGVGNGVMLYNLFKVLPVEMTVYNIGSIFSAALIAYLGVRNRKTSAVATFSIHRTHDSVQSGNLIKFQAIADMLAANDTVTEAILRKHVTLSTGEWDKLNHDGQLYFTGQEAVNHGIADQIGDFNPPPGTKFTVI